MAYVAARVAELDPPERVVEFGSLNVNGSVRHLFGDATYVGVDLRDGPGVDVIGDAVDVPLEGFDVVVCTEVLEHYDRPWLLVRKAARAVRPGGVFIATAAGPGREPHANDGGPHVGSEHYANVAPGDLEDWCRAAGFSSWEVDVLGADVRCTARR